MAVPTREFSSFIPLINVREIGAYGDAQKVIDAVITNGSSTVTSASGRFAASDVGKEIWGVVATTVVLTRRTITGYNSPTSITVSSTATSGWTGVKLVWGHDDTESLQEAAALAKSSRKGLYVPGGGYIFADNEPQGIFTERTLTYFTEKIRYLRLEARSPAFGPGNRPPAPAI